MSPGVRPGAPGRPGVPAWLAAALLLTLPASAAAQAGGAAERRPHDRADRGTAAAPTFEVSAGTGVLAPLARLSSDPGAFATELSTSASVGAAATWWLTPSLGLEVAGRWAPARLNVLRTEFTGPIPDDLGDADYLAGTLEGVYRLRLSGAAAVVEPFLALGAGLRRLSFDPIAQLDVQDTTDLAGSAAVGAKTRLSEMLAIRLEVRDVVSSFDATSTGESTLQNDIFVTVGLSVRP